MPSYTLITGASSGIGKATAELLAKHGRNLILIARRGERLAAIKTALEEQYSIEVITEALDLKDKKKTEQFFSSISHLQIDAVINNAGLAVERLPFDQYNFNDVQEMVDVNISAFLRVAHAGMPFLKKSKGHLVNLGSIAGMQAYGGGAVYCGTKHFVHAFSHGLRQDLLGSGVRVTVIAPGNVDTEFSMVRFKGDTAKATVVYDGYEPLHAADIAAAVYHALSAPPHVNTELMLVMPTAQAGLTIAKKSR